VDLEFDFSDEPWTCSLKTVTCYT